MKVWKEPAGVISELPVWCCYSDGYLYIADTLLQLLLVMIKEWQHDRHLVG